MCVCVCAACVVQNHKNFLYAADSCSFACCLQVLVRPEDVSPQKQLEEITQLFRTRHPHPIALRVLYSHSIHVFDYVLCVGNSELFVRFFLFAFCSPE
jgi:hypothetical protein